MSKSDPTRAARYTIITAVIFAGVASITGALEIWGLFASFALLAILFPLWVCAISLMFIVSPEIEKWRPSNDLR